MKGHSSPVTHPQYYAAFPPRPERMPGTTATAVVLLWIMFGAGLCVSLIAPAYGFLGAVMTNGGLPPGILPGLLVVAAVLVVWSVLRAVAAVKLRRRSRRARLGAIVLEGTGLVLTVAVMVVASRSPAQGSGGVIAFDFSAVLFTSPGIVPSLIIIVMLALSDSQRWCDR